MTDPVTPPDEPFVPDPAGDSRSDDTVSSERSAADAQPAVAPTDAAPSDSTSSDSVPADSTSSDSTSPDSAPADSAPSDVALSDSTTSDPASTDAAPSDGAASDISADSVPPGVVLSSSTEIELYEGPPGKWVFSQATATGREIRSGFPIVRFGWAAVADAGWLVDERLRTELLLYGYDPLSRIVVRDAMLEEIVQIERDEAALHARRTRLLNQYRLHTEESVRLTQEHSALLQGAPVGVKKAGWNGAVIAQREMTSEIATAIRKSENTVAQLIHEAEILSTALPATLEALETGQISYRHGSVIASQARDVPEELLGEFEDAVVPAAAVLTVPKVKHRARLVRERMHPESIDSRKKKAARGRYMDVDPAEDGMAFLTVKLSAVDATAINNRYADTATILQTKDEERTFGQLKVDAFRDVAINGTIPTDSPNRTTNPSTTDTTTNGADGHGDTDGDIDADGAVGAGEVMAGLAATGVAATVLVMVPALTLLDRSDEPAVLEGYGPIDTDTAKELAAGAASWTRVLTDPETGVVMSVGQTRYRVPAAMRLWLRIRDLICRFPGCNRLAKYCDLDHILDWAYGGHTSTDNLQHLCPGHHNLKGYTSWSVKYLDNGRIEWVSPAGRTHTTDPEIPLHFTPTPPQDREHGDEGDDPETSGSDQPRQVWGFNEAWDAMEAREKDGWYTPPTEGPTPF